MRLLNRSFWVLFPLFAILTFCHNAFLDSTQPIKFFLLSIFCLSSNCILLFRFKQFNLEVFKFKIVKGYMVYLLIGLLSLFYTSNLANGIYDWLKVFLSFNFMFLTFHFLKSQKQPKWSELFNIFVVFQYLVVGSVFWSILNSEISFVWFQTKIGGGLFVNANLSSQLLFLSLPFTIYIFFDSKNRLQKMIYGFSSALSLFAITALGSRTIFLALAAMTITSLILFFYKTRNLNFSSKKRILTVTFSLLAFIVITFLTIKYYYPSLSNSSSFKIRTELWHRTLSSIKDKPIQGHGLGSWRVNNLNYISDNTTFESELALGHIYTRNGVTSYLRPHNDFLWICSEVGILGLLMYILLFVMAIRFGLIAIKKANKKDSIRYCLLTGTLFSYLIIAALSFPKERIEQSLFLVLLFTLLQYGASNQLQPNKNNVLAKNSLWLLLPVLLCSFSVYFAYDRLISEYHFTKALTAQQNQTWRELLKETEKARTVFYPTGPQGVPVDWYSGLAAINLNEKEKALQYFRKAYKEHNNHIHVIGNLATTNMMTGNIDRAKELYLKALRINPNFEDARINLSGVYFNEGKIDLAWQNIKLIHPETSNSHYKIFIEAILKAKYEEEFLILASERGFRIAAEKFLQSEKNNYYWLYKDSFKNNISIRGSFLKQFTPRQ